MDTSVTGGEEIHALMLVAFLPGKISLRTHAVFLPAAIADFDSSQAGGQYSEKTEALGGDVT